MKCAVIKRRINSDSCVLACPANKCQFSKPNLQHFSFAIPGCLNQHSMFPMEQMNILWQTISTRIIGSITIHPKRNPCLVAPISPMVSRFFECVAKNLVLQLLENHNKSFCSECSSTGLFLDTLPRSIPASLNELHFNFSIMISFGQLNRIANSPSLQLSLSFSNACFLQETYWQFCIDRSTLPSPKPSGFASPLEHRLRWTRCTTLRMPNNIMPGK